VDSCPQGSEVECTTTCGSTGTGTCDSSCNLPAPSECTPPDETCNGLDDDCDDVLDNGFDCAAGAEVACTTTCGSTGTGACLDTCQDPPPGACIPPDETCNGLDDDCVLGADNGFDCIAGADVTCTTTCGSTGAGACTDACAIPSPSSCTPPTETCNWADDDCGDDVDEGLWDELISDVTVAGASTDALGPALAYGTTSFLIAWSENPGAGLGLYTEALDLTGSSLGGGARIAGPNLNIAGDIAWSGSEFVVGFQDSRYGNADVWGVRVAENGEPVTVEVNISTAENGVESIRVNWTGSAWGFSWLDMRAGTRLYIADVEPVTLIRSYEFPVTGGAGSVFGHFDSAWTGSSFGICWGDDRAGSRQLYFKTVSRMGVDVVTDTAITTVFDEVYTCSIAWTGSEFVVGWAGRKLAGLRAGYVMRVSEGGSVVGTDVFVDQVASSSPGRPVWVEVADGLGIGVAWSRYGGGRQSVVVRRYTFELDVLGEAVVASDGTSDAVSPVLAWDGSAFGVAWEEMNSVADSDVTFSRVGCP